MTGTSREDPQSPEDAMVGGVGNEGVFPAKSQLIVKHESLPPPLVDDIKYSVITQPNAK